MVPVLLVIAVMWVVEVVDLLTPFSLDVFGIRPREVDHLAGIVLSPFLHAGFGHLLANTTALVVLGSLLALATRHLWIVTAGVIVVGGLGVWLTGAPNSVHIGASGLVYGYAAFLAVYGFVARHLKTAMVGVLVIVLYGSMLWGVLPLQAGVSWQGHLFGAVAGALLAVGLGRRDRR
ncbi:rhomboid family intramembrane serine protease [Mobilicoccus caccae]|uniref:rhomboid family intramembrane serine protease n=1 Tax=Mobilicoccus caccae TaxID=1859295 RepID=UPI0024E07F33|nr:rhomboid family intramembrane serine protease [Mobilicoccus caccae]